MIRRQKIIFPFNFLSAFSVERLRKNYAIEKYAVETISEGDVETMKMQSDAEDVIGQGLRRIVNLESRHC